MPRLNKFKCLDYAMKDDGGADIEVGRRISTCGSMAVWHMWKKITRVLYDKRVPNWVKKESILR